MIEVPVTEDEQKLVEMYREMDADCKEFALMLFRAMKSNGKLFAKLEIMSNNRVGGNGNLVIGSGTIHTGQSKADTEDELK